MPWLLNLLAALMLHFVLGGNRFPNYDELSATGTGTGSGTGTGTVTKRCSRFLGDCQEREEVVNSQQIETDASTSKMLNALFGLVQSTANPVHPTESALTPYQLPAMYYNEFYEDLLTNKRNDVHSAGCDCKVMNDLLDLGSLHFPRYLMSAICEPALDAKCSQGSNCKPLEYKVKVLTLGPDQVPPKAAKSSAALSRPWLTEEELPQPWLWEFKTVTVTAGCFCTN